MPITVPPPVQPADSRKPGPLPPSDPPPINV